MDNAIFHQWLNRKLSNQYWVLGESRTVSEKYDLNVGPRHIYGEIELTATPTQSFQFTSNATWPSVDSNYELYVLDGILDVLLASNTSFILGATFVLEQIKYHDVYSCANGYYHAARLATEKIIGKGYSGNYVLS